MIRSTVKSIAITVTLFIFPMISVHSSEPINVDELFEKKFLGKPVHVHGTITEHDPPNVMLHVLGDEITRASDALGGLGLNIKPSSDKKLLQKLFIQCKNKPCSLKGKLYQNENTMLALHDMVLDSYTVGIHPESTHVKTLIQKDLFGTPVFYEGPIEWGRSIEYSRVKKNRGWTTRFGIDFSKLNETKKMELLDIFDSCQKIRVEGVFGNKRIHVARFRCLDNS